MADNISLKSISFILVRGIIFYFFSLLWFSFSTPMYTGYLMPSMSRGLGLLNGICSFITLSYSLVLFSFYGDKN